MRKPLEHHLGLEYPALLVAEPEGGTPPFTRTSRGAWPWGRPRRFIWGRGPKVEALANLEEARRLWLETAYQYGDEIPSPPSWPFGRQG
jgi:antitoxin HicB